MEKLRIQKMPYINQGTANKNLKGRQEYHAVFKFDTDEKAKDFIIKVKEWYYSLGEVDEIKTETNELPKINVKRIPRKKPGPQKGQGGRPSQKNIQR